VCGQVLFALNCSPSTVCPQQFALNCLPFSTDTIINHHANHWTQLNFAPNVAEINILIELEMPYRILRLCGGDLGFTSALTYDFELFSTAQEKWLEISSVSTFEGFQSERLRLRYKSKDGSKHLVHTLNGSALALPRVLAGILENCQTLDGIKIPKVLVPYTGFDLIS
jgi:seryl-tRNA synthetase